MSDSHSSGGTPPDGPPPEPSPYGQPPPAQPAYGQQPPPPPQYSQPQYGQQQYGQPAYGQAPGSQPYGTVDPDKRPGTVTAAGVITIIMGGLTGLAFGVLTLLVLVSRDEMVDSLRTEGELDNLTTNDVNAVAVVCAIATVWSLISIVLAVLAMRRSNGARIALVISSAVTALASLLLVWLLIPALNLIAAVAVIVLLFTGGAGPWFKREAPPATPGMQQY
jgi:hypothetical protein